MLRHFEPRPLTAYEMELCDFFAEWGVESMVAFRNFRSNEGTLQGPAGYAASVLLNAPFRRDLFINAPFGLGVSLYKVKPRDDWDESIPASV